MLSGIFLLSCLCDASAQLAETAGKTPACQEPAVSYEAPRPAEKVCRDLAAAAAGPWGNAACDAAFWQYAAKQIQDEKRLSPKQTSEAWRSEWTPKEKTAAIDHALSAYRKDQAAFAELEASFGRMRGSCLTQDAEAFATSIRSDFNKAFAKAGGAVLERLHAASPLGGRGDLQKAPAVWSNTLNVWWNEKKTAVSTVEFQKKTEADERKVKDAAEQASGARDDKDAKLAADEMFREGAAGGRDSREQGGKGATALLAGDKAGPGQLAIDAAITDRTQAKYARSGKALPLPDAKKAPADKAAKTPGQEAIDQLKRKEALLAGAAKVPLFGRAVDPGLQGARRERMQLEAADAKADWLKANGKGDMASEYDRILKLPPAERSSKLAEWQGRADAAMKTSPSAAKYQDLMGRTRDTVYGARDLDQQIAESLKDPKLPPRVRELASKPALTEAERKELDQGLPPRLRDLRREREALGRQAVALDQEVEAFRAKDGRYFEAASRSEAYVQNNRENLSRFKDGTSFRPDELGFDPAKAPAPALTKTTRNGQMGLQFGTRDPATGLDVQRFESSDGKYARDEMTVNAMTVATERHYAADGRLYASRIPQMNEKGELVHDAKGRPKYFVQLNPAYDYSKFDGRLPDGVKASEVQEAFRLSASNAALSRRDARGNPVYAAVVQDGRISVQGDGLLYTYEKDPSGKIHREVFDPKGFGDRPVSMADLTPRQGGYDVEMRALHSEHQDYYKKRREDWRTYGDDGIDRTSQTDWSHPEGVKRTYSVGDARWDALTTNNPAYKAVQTVGKPLAWAGKVVVHGVGGTVGELAGYGVQGFGGETAGAWMSVRGNITRGKAVGTRSDEQIVKDSLDTIVDHKVHRDIKERLMSDALEAKFQREEPGGDWNSFRRRFEGRYSNDEARLKALSPYIVSNEGVEGGLREIRSQGTAGIVGAKLISGADTLGQVMVGAQAVNSLKGLAQGSKAAAGAQAARAENLFAKSVNALDKVDDATGRADLVLGVTQAATEGSVGSLAETAANMGVQKLLKGRKKSAEGGGDATAETARTVDINQRLAEAKAARERGDVAGEQRILKSLEMTAAGVDGPGAVRHDNPTNIKDLLKEGPNKRDLLRDPDAVRITEGPGGKKAVVISEAAMKEAYEKAKATRENQRHMAQDILRDLGVKGEVVSVTKGQDPTGKKEVAYPDFKEGVAEKFNRKVGAGKDYATLDKMTDMSRGRINVDDPGQAQDVALALAKKGQPTGITYPKGTPPHVVAQLKAACPQCKVEVNSHPDYPRIHVDVRDPRTGLVQEWQIGTKRYNELQQVHSIDLQRLPPKVQDSIRALDPTGVEGGKAHFHLVEYDLMHVNIMQKHPEIGRKYGVDKFLTEFDDAVRASNGQGHPGARVKSTPELSQEASRILTEMAAKEPGLFTNLGH